MEILKNNYGIKELEILQKQTNENNNYLIESKYDKYKKYYN